MRASESIDCKRYIYQQVKTNFTHTVKTTKYRKSFNFCCHCCFVHPRLSDHYFNFFLLHSFDLYDWCWFWSIEDFTLSGLFYLFSFQTCSPHFNSNWLKFSRWNMWQVLKDVAVLACTDIRNYCLQFKKALLSAITSWNSLDLLGAYVCYKLE